MPLLHTTASFSLVTLDALRFLPAQEYDEHDNPLRPIDPVEYDRLVAFYTGRVIYRVRVVCNGKHAAFESAPVLPEERGQALTEVFALAATSCAQHILQTQQSLDETPDPT